MSHSENISDSDSSDSDAFTRVVDEWKVRRREQNRRIDHLLEDAFVVNPSLILGDPPPTRRRRYVNRERRVGEERLINDYFGNEPMYSAEIFQRRFRIQRSLFLRIVEAVSTNDVYFQQRTNAAGTLGLTGMQKYTGAIRVLAYEISTDVVDEYLKMGASTTRQTLIKFVDGVISCFGNEYLRRPNAQDLARLLYVGEQRGFPGRSRKATIILETVTSYDLWIWHAFFGTPGTLNDINVLERSPVFSDVLEGRAPKVSYVVNNRQYDMAYYLTDGIYPTWAAFVKSITSPSTLKHKLFAEHQEAARKDVERAFRVLQARFAFIRRPPT